MVSSSGVRSRSQGGFVSKPKLTRLSDSKSFFFNDKQSKVNTE